jgi:hypothetical protein
LPYGSFAHDTTFFWRGEGLEVGGQEPQSKLRDAFVFLTPYFTYFVRVPYCPAQNDFKTHSIYGHCLPLIPN